MITLFIGRFQPFHNGHLYDIRNALKFSDKVIIGIGSSQEKNTSENPLSYEERKRMIEDALSSAGVTKFKIISIPDINDDSKWVEHVKSIAHKFDIVYTGNPYVKKLFLEKGFRVKDVEFLPGINATDIRKRAILEKKWEELVPVEVADYLKKIDAVSRIRQINGFQPIK